MAAVVLWLRTQARKRWRGWLGLAVAFGIAAGGATAAAAGARRASTAFPRLVQWSGSFDISTGGLQADESEYLPALAELETLPQVADSARLYSWSSSPGSAIVTADGREVSFPKLIAGLVPPGEVDGHGFRLKILRGRQVRPDRPNEATIAFSAEGPGLHVGDTIRLTLSDYTKDPAPTRTVSVRIVGVHADPQDFPSVNGPSFPFLNLSPAFLAPNRQFIHDDSNELGLGIKLKRGAADIDAFREEVFKRRIPIEFPDPTADRVAGVQKTMRFETDALWLLSALLGVAAFAIFGQALARQALLDSDDHPVLGALGMSRRHLMLAGVLRAAVMGLIAALVAVAIAVLTSPLTPIGLARIAEPEPGIRIDGPALLLGAIAAAFLVVAVSVPVAARAARAAKGEGAQGITSSSRLATALARAGAGPSAVSGVRMAVEAGRGRTAVPVRSAIFGTALGVGALVMSLVFVTSLHRLIDTPRLYGFTWSVQLAGDAELPASLLTDPRVLEVKRGGANNVEIAGARMLALTFEEGGLVEPVVVEGRAPRGPNEIVLGRLTMRRAGARIGSTIRVTQAQNEGEDPNAPRPYADLRVVGRAVTPGFFFERHEPGVGAAMTNEAADRISPPGEGEFSYLVRFAPGVDADAFLRGTGGEAFREHVHFVVPQLDPAALSTLDRVSAVPVLLAALLALMGAATLVHSLVTSVRRRRRDLAILKTLGFVRSQTRAAVAWQTSTTATLALAIGIPLGIAAGRWGWRQFAEQLSVLPQPIVPLVTVLLLIPATFLIANVIAAFPARAAANTRPALVLRTE